MTPEQWHRVKEVFEAALERAPSERSAFLGEACAGDDSLHSEVQSLLSSYEQESRFMETPAAAIAAQSLMKEETAALVGQELGHYQIVRELGRGGMGVVYLAQDVRLNRPVALKLLPAHLIGDPDRLHRFEREARAASALNHPNILTIYEITEIDDCHFIATEFIDGETLRERIKSKDLKLTEALNITEQMASALSAAHEAGIVHRDIKPENVMLRRDGYVKVLDFGLAKLTEQQAVLTTAASTPTVGTYTNTGIMGTLGYMSPEQARGESVDQRTDIFSLGVVLYEMLTGRMPFEIKTPGDIRAAMFEHEPPPLTDYSPKAPAKLQLLVSKALRKNREERHQTVNQLLTELKGVGSEDLARNRFTVKRLSLLAAALALLIVGPLWFYASRRTVKSALEAPPAARKRVRLTAGHGHAYVPRFSPDGKRVAYTSDERNGNYDIYVRLLDGGVEKQLTTNAGSNGSPVWSPDGQYIAFTRFSGSATEGERAIFMVPAVGSTERKLLTAKKVWDQLLAQIDWSPTGEFIAYADEEAPGRPYAISLLTVETREPRQLTSPPEKVIGDVQPAFSPDGKMLAFVRMSGMWISDIYVMPLLGGEPRRLTFDNQIIQGVAWTPDEHSIVFGSPRGGTMSLWRISLAGGTPEPLGVADNASYPAFSGNGQRMAYNTTSIASSMWGVALPAMHDKPGTTTKLYSSTAWDGLMQISPDGKRIAVTSDRSGTNEVWVCDSDFSHPQQLTALDHVAGSPSWSPDGRFIAFDVHLEEKPDIYVIGVDGGPSRRLTDNPAEDSMPSWSRDGRWIYFVSDRSGNSELWKIHPEGGDAVQVTTRGGSPAFESRDGRYVYYQKGHYIPGLWRMPVEGGEEELMFDRLSNGQPWSLWALADDGVYFDESAKTGEVIKFYSFATRRVTQIATLDWLDGLALSPDQRWLLYANRDSEIVNIMLVENFS